MGFRPGAVYISTPPSIHRCTVEQIWLFWSVREGGNGREREIMRGEGWVRREDGGMEREGGKEGERERERESARARLPRKTAAIVVGK